MSALSLRLPLRFLRGSYTRLALTVIALACGVGLVCALDLVTRAVVRSFVEVIDTMAGRAALQVSAGDGGFIREELADTVATVPGVELAVPIVSASAFVSDASGELLTVYGIDTTREEAVRMYAARDDQGAEIDDPLVFLSRPDSIVLTHSFVSRRGLALGSRITLETPVGRRDFTVRGLLEPKGVARVYGGNLAVMDVWAAEAIFARPGFINRIDVVVHRGADVGRVRDAIAGVLTPGLSIEAPPQRKADLHRVMQSFQIMLRAVAMLGLLAAFLIAFNRLATVFDARVAQLGILRAVGARSRIVWRELVKESAVLGGAAVLMGIPLGAGLGYLLLPVIATAAALNYKLVAPEAELNVSGSSIALAAALGFGAALAAAALPAWRAARTALAVALLRRGEEQPDVSPRAGQVLRGVVALTTAYALLEQSLTHSVSWGLLATALIAIGVALCARPLVDVLHRPAAHVLARAFGAAGRFAGATIFRHRRRSALIISTLGIGVGLILWLWTVANSFEASVVASLSSAFNADLFVTSSRVVSGFDGAPVDGKITARVRRLNGVAAAIGERIIDWHYAGGPIAIDAFDPAYFASGRFGRWHLFGPRHADVWDGVARGDAVVVSTSFARNLAKGVGDVLTLETPSGPLRVKIAGVNIAFASPRGTIEMSRAIFERFWHDRQVTRVHIAVAEGADVKSLRAAVAARLGKRYALQILSSGELLEFWTGQVRQAFGFINVLVGLILLVVFIGMADTLVAGVGERTRELGGIRAIGGRRSDVIRIVVLEGLVLSLAGLGLAAAAGLALGILWVDGTFPNLLGWYLELHLPYRQAAAVGILSVTVCLLAAFVAARQAARLDPAVALRYE